jgi:phosphatidylglycerol:prolipoprotein diacylglycerol transferase
MAILPYVDVPNIHIAGPVQITSFGLLVAAGVMFGSWMGARYARRNGLDEDAMRYLSIRLIVWGFIACHVFNTLFYEWDRFQEEPLLMLKIWDGISSWGGVIGGALALYVYTGIRKLDRLRWGDWAGYAAIAAWVPGRLACAVVHDHLGYPTDFGLAVDFPPHKYPFDKMSAEVVRAHDLGLYEIMYLVPLLLVVVILERWRGRRPGFLIGFVAVAYSVPRFFLDFLRRTESDPRYLYLTFAQWACIGGVLLGIRLLRRRAGHESVAVPVADAGDVPRTAPTPRKPPARKKK